MTVKKLEQFELLGREFVAGLAALYPERLWIHGCLPDIEWRTRVGFASGWLWRPAQECVNPGEQFPHAERLGHIIVRAQIQADHLVDLLSLGGQHEDGSLNVFGAQLPANLIPAQS